MKKLISIFAFCCVLFSTFAQTKDSLQLHFPVSKTGATTPDELLEMYPMDLESPSNIHTYIVFDAKRNEYVFQTRLGDTVLDEPFRLTPKQYMDFVMRDSFQKYFRKKNEITQDESINEERKFSFAQLRKPKNILGEIFGKGGVRLQTQGSIELSGGLQRTVVNNPALPERSRKRNMFDFDQKIDLNATAKVGDKINFGLNYNTGAMFDFDAKRIKLVYDGKEDEILKHIEAGNVSMTTTNSLINGGAALFGIKTDMQFGKLRVNTVISQQKAESKTLNSQGGVQTTPFEFGADQYDENRHFFLGNFFRNSYDRAMSKAPFIQSAISITRIEVWITNKRGNYDQARNILAFADLGESSRIHNNLWIAESSLGIPYNEANNQYRQLTTTYAQARDLSQAGNALPQQLIIGQDYEKIESARLLSETDYTLQSQLGYISLRVPLQADEVLAVAYEFTYNGQAYQVGEFSNNIGRDQTTNAQQQGGTLFLKLLKPTSFSPQSYTWDLMMKNIYTLSFGASNIQPDRFRLNIMYQSDTNGVYLNYIPEGKIDKQLLLRVMNLDRLNQKNDPYSDGMFDYLEGLTIHSCEGQIIFPVIEPFGKHLRKAIGDDAVADKYVFEELYTHTLTAARQVAEKNKFKIKGEYRGSSGSEIDLNAMNVAQGSVVVKAAGAVLTEGTDYTIDYISGKVNILNQSILDAGTPVSVSIENQSLFNLQRKTMMGINLMYDFSKDFSLGTTLMHLSERPLTSKINFGEESVRNTLWGVNASYRKTSYALTNLLDMLPFVEATEPSHLTANAEFAHIIPGHYTDKQTGAYSYLDDFENSASNIDLRSPYAWSLAATPFNNTASALFPEAALTNNIEYGKNRAQLAWFYIDGIFTRQNSNATPEHIKNDRNQLSNHLVREIYEREIYPNRDAVYGQPSTIPVLNLSYYPNERGPYNLDTHVDSNNHLLNPRQRWGGITRKMDTRDFESANIEYIQFWIMDPFVNDANSPSRGGDLYFNLGEISEDVLKDGKKFFENGLPLDGDETAVENTVWGKVPKRQSTVYAFDNSQGATSRQKQDVGFNGLSNEEEKTFPTYANYLQEMEGKLSGSVASQLRNDPMSLFNNPAGDKFRHYRGAEQDAAQMSILERYKYYNGVEGNSASQDTDTQFSTASRNTPDVEDIDQDNTLNENESYYQYKVKLRPEDMQVGSNFIMDKREVSVRLRNGEDGHVTWYQFKIPIRDYQAKIGNIQGFKTIRFMRMFLTDFEQPVFLRFGTLELVRSEWRTYTNDLQSGGSISGVGKLDISALNIEENGDRTPVNYVLPPGVSRILDPSQPQLRQQNEQSLALKVQNLEPSDTRAIYKNTMYDFRRFKKLQMFVHAERLAEDAQTLQDGDLTVFLRLGSDYRNNYYEYEIPLHLTPQGKYSAHNLSDREAVWNPGNMFDFPLEILTRLKLNRNAEKRQGSGINYLTPYTQTDPDKPNNKITIMGNPSLAEVKVMMVGIRNRANSNRSGEIWINELRLSEFDEKGGWAAQGNMNLALSDIATINVAGRKETVGFGALDQRLMERRNDDYQEFNISINADLGRFLPEKAKIKAPFYYSVSNNVSAPKYNPLDKDVLLSESLASMDSRQDRDSLKAVSQIQYTNKSLSLNNATINIKSKNPMPYDPANFSVSYSQNISTRKEPEIAYATSKDYKLQTSYVYAPTIQPLEPFKNIKSQSGWLKLIKSLNFNYLPNNIQLTSNLMRNYQEMQLRDMNAFASGEPSVSRAYLTFSQKFLWDRTFDLTWDLTRNLKASFKSGTMAEIEEPHLQVNRKLNRDDYEIWKDSVMQSILKLGRPLNYEQTANVTYTVPFNQIPILDWISSSATYNSRYSWQRGAFISDEKIGNYLENDIALTFNNRLNLTSFYNKIPYLKSVNQRFDRVGQKEKEKPLPKKFTKTVTLHPDSTTEILHNLDSRKIWVTARSNGRPYALKYKTEGRNKIRINNRDSANVDITVTSVVSENSILSDIAAYATRGLMMVRNINITYGYKSRTDLPGFEPMIGDIFGQKSINGMLIPGAGFAFGWEGGESYINKALENNWLIRNENNIEPAIFNSTGNFRAEATLEPVRGMTITLDAIHEDNRRTEFRYMVEGMPKIFGGSFAMSTISLLSGWEKSNATNNYASASFRRFLENREVIAGRIESHYRNARYPNQGFTKGLGIGGQNYNPQLGTLQRNGADVLIPSFLAAYTGKDARTIGLTPFPDLLSVLPNWDVSYNVMTMFPSLKNKFRSFMINHKYVSQYRVGTYASFLNWVPTDDNSGLGFVRDVLSGNPIPSSALDIALASLVETFNPLLEVRGVLTNGMTVNLRMNRSRTLNLNMASYQIVETSDNDLVFGLGYRWMDFNRVIGIGSNSSRNDRRRRSASSQTRQDADQRSSSSDFSNDLDIRVDIAQKNGQALIRKIEDGFTQATSGIKTTTIKISADYALSRSLTLRAFFDKNINTPLVSSTSYPIANTNAGLSIRFNLNQ